MNQPRIITGRDYLAFLTCRNYWDGISTGGTLLLVDGKRRENHAPAGITDDSYVTILAGDVFEGFDRLHSLYDHYDSWAIKRDELAELKRQHDEYNAGLKAKGVAMLTYTVPCCGGAMESRIGPDEGQWDTLATCPHCGAMYMKISTATAIIARVPSDTTTERTA